MLGDLNFAKYSTKLRFSLLIIQSSQNTIIMSDKNMAVSPKSDMLLATYRLLANSVLNSTKSSSENPAIKKIEV
jgi:hypothetical protein